MHRRYFLTLVILLWPGAFLKATDLPPSATLLDGEFFCWEKWKEPTIAVSPDGKTIAYVNKGAIWQCQVDGSGSSKLAELKGTIDEFLAKAEFGDARGQEWKVRRSLGNAAFNQSTVDMSKVDSMQWRRSGKAVVYALADHAQSGIHAARYQIMEASKTDEVHSIVTIDRDVGDEPHALTAFHVRADNKFVVSTGPFPLIWDVEANKPVATPFDYLLPSSTSDRYLGIEIDTRQLVLVDENFKITKRFDVTFEQQRACDLIWSADERFAICRAFRSGLEPISDKCSVFRIDLKTGKRRDLKPGFGRDRFIFSGKDGEVLRVGVVGVHEEPHYGDGTYGSYFEIVPDGDGKEQEIYRFGSPGDEHTSEWHLRFYPPVSCNSDCSLLALARPRKPDEKPGFHYCLMDRDGRTWVFPDGNQSDFISPYIPIAFVEGGEKLVAHDESRLFSIPVAAIKAAAEEKK